MKNKLHEKFMALAIEEAKVAKANGDWPFGAIVVKDGIVIGKGHVKDKTGGDVTDHAEPGFPYRVNPPEPALEFRRGRE